MRFSRASTDLIKMERVITECTTRFSLRAIIVIIVVVHIFYIFFSRSPPPTTKRDNFMVDRKALPLARGEPPINVKLDYFSFIHE